MFQALREKAAFLRSINVYESLAARRICLGISHRDETMQPVPLKTILFSLFHWFVMSLHNQCEHLDGLYPHLPSTFLTMAENTLKSESKAKLEPEPLPTSFKHKCVSDEGESAYSDLLHLLSFQRRDSDNVVFRRFQNLHLLYLMALQHQLKHCVEQLREYNTTTHYKGTLFEILDRVGPLLKNYSKWAPKTS